MVHQRRRFGNWGEEAAVRYLENRDMRSWTGTTGAVGEKSTSLPGTGECWPLWK